MFALDSAGSRALLMFERRPNDIRLHHSCVSEILIVDIATGSYSCFGCSDAIFVSAAF